MNKLQQAYIDLGLKPGAPLDHVLDRWRTVARMWHPDRAASEQERQIAEAELKKVNGARDLIARHYQDGLHKLVGCECAAPDEQRQTEPDPPPRSQHYQQNAQNQQQQQRKTNGTNGGTSTARRKRRVEPVANPAIASVLTAAMVVFGMFIVRMNSGVSVANPQTEIPTVQTRWNSEMQTGVRPSTIMALRPTAESAAATTVTAQAEQPEEEQQAQDQTARKARAKKEKPVAPELPPNTSLIEFVSSDGRLINLQDGTTWELWYEEAPESFFHWQRGDHVIMKGLDRSPCYIVNQTRSYQAVKVSSIH